MSGSSLWAIIGPIVLFAGLVLIAIGIARRRRGGRLAGRCRRVAGPGSQFGSTRRYTDT